MSDEALPEDTPPEVAPVRPGEQLDWKTLEQWLLPRLAEAIPGLTPPIEVEQFPNGSANLTYLCASEGTSSCCGALRWGRSRRAPTT